MNTQPCFKALSGIGRMHRFGGTVGGVSTRFGRIESRIRKLGSLGAWLGCALVIGLGVSPSAIAQETVTYIHTDALGSVVAESDANGNVIKRYVYEPYGAAVGGQVMDGPGYTGHVSDSATGLSYMQQRYMDPQLGVFLSVDPVTAYDQPVLQFNRFRYGNGNPYKFTDPDGRESGAAFKVVNDATNGQPITPPPRNPNDRLGPAIGAALTAILAAPVLAEAGLAAMANPAAVATATEIGAGAAGLTGTSGAVVGKITGYTKHGLNQAISRDGGRGVSTKAILTAVREPAKVAEQAGGKTAYTGKDAKVVLNGEGKVITAIPRNSDGLRDPKVK
ncbi:RHS repeat-associated core domain-containing protein [Stenotrophomonas indicatrix]|uniref:RHS repeat-associated core domain-containing protein n=2 Tax=Stenotrophomonas indicatrix TaxID=2045451 RepID=UPI00264FF297|nr:RHS repeat-associated core domain-containing protein [Stenotrophomonas indicatrix]MDN8644502.1 RHS repeat-associated core domain-containing protein [Stenotrophomonas indicatrix]